MPCKHPRLQVHAFADGVKIKLCPDCTRFDGGRKKKLRTKSEAIATYATHRQLGETVTERCFREILIGKMSGNGLLILRGVRGLFTTARKACRTIIIPNMASFEYRGRIVNDGGASLHRRNCMRLDKRVRDPAGGPASRGTSAAGASRSKWTR